MGGGERGACTPSRADPRHDQMPPRESMVSTKVKCLSQPPYLVSQSGTRRGGMSGKAAYPTMAMQFMMSSADRALCAGRGSRWAPVLGAHQVLGGAAAAETNVQQGRVKFGADTYVDSCTSPQQADPGPA